MANRYWVGGTAAWDGTAGSKWALTSGGAGGQAVPTSADDVFFNAASGAGTCTVVTARVARSVNFTGFTGTFNMQSAATLTLSGSATFVAGMTLTISGASTAIIFNATATITSAGKTLPGVTVNATGGTVTLADALTVSTINATTLTAGTLALANFNLSTGIFSSSGTSTRAISFGSGNIALTSTNAATVVLAMATVTGFSWTGTGGFTRNQAATATVSLGGTAGGSTVRALNLTVNAGSATLTITTNSWFKNVDFTGSTSTVSGGYNASGNLTLASGGTYTSLSPTFRESGTVTSTGKTIDAVTVNASGGTVTLADAMTLNTNSTFTLTAGTLDLANFNLSAGAFSSNNSNTRAITFGSGNIALTSITASVTVLSMLNAVNFTCTGTGGFTRNQATTASMVFGTSGGTVSNAPNLTVNAGASTLTISDTSWFKNVDFTGSTCTVAPLIGVVGLNMAGNLTLASGGTYTLVAPTLRASGTLTSNGTTLSSTTVNGSGITVTLADALTLGSASTLTLTQGTFTAANFNVTAGSFSSNNSNTRTLNMGSGTWTLLSAPPPGAWDTTTTTGLTFNPSTSTISVTSAATKAFNGGGLTYYNLNQGGAGQTNISGSNAFNDITNTVQPATLRFTAGTTQTVSNFSLSGTAGNLITINSLTPGSQFTLSKASGTVNAQYLSIQDSVATGGAVWNALTSNGNVNAGNNTGWIFSLAGGNMFLMFN